MSIDAILNNLLNNEALFELESLFTGDETARTMIVSPDIMAVVLPPFPETEMGERLGELRAWLDNFLEGGEITVAEDPDAKPADVMLARVHPIRADFWSIRVTEPTQTPGIRALGAFAGKDKFVALSWDYREDMADFDGDVQSAIDYWKDLFGGELPFKGRDLDEYLSNFRAV